MTSDSVRAAEPADMEPLAQLWFKQWHVAHAAYVPTEFVGLRTLADFERRLSKFGDRLRTIGPVGAPLGMCVVKDHELDQIYVNAGAQGSGIASQLLDDAEASIARAGHELALLVCVKENLRAQKFYRRNGWVFVRTDIAMLETSTGTFPLETFHFEKILPPPAL